MDLFTLLQQPEAVGQGTDDYGDLVIGTDGYYLNTNDQIANKGQLCKFLSRMDRTGPPALSLF